MYFKMVSCSHKQDIYNTPLQTRLREHYGRGGGWIVRAGVTGDWAKQYLPDTP